MAENRSVSAENQSVVREGMSEVALVQSEIGGRVRALTEPARPGECVKACIRRVSVKTGLTFSQIKRLWYGEWRVIHAHVADRIREASEAHEREIEQQIAYLKEHQARLYALAHYNVDAEFYQTAIGPSGDMDH